MLYYLNLKIGINPYRVLTSEREFCTMADEDDDEEYISPYEQDRLDKQKYDEEHWDEHNRDCHPEIWDRDHNHEKPYPAPEEPDGDPALNPPRVKVWDPPADFPKAMRGGGGQKNQSTASDDDMPWGWIAFLCLVAFIIIKAISS